MITQLFTKKELHFERSYDAPLDAVWDAWTRAELLSQWWGPEKTTIPECEVDLQVGGTIYIVTEATEAMGKYAGTRWPMRGTFTRIDERQGLTYEAQSWTEGEDDATIHHVNDLVLSSDGASTTVTLHISITQIGKKAKMAAFGMKWGYKAQLNNLAELLESGS